MVVLTPMRLEGRDEKQLQIPPLPLVGRNDRLGGGDSKREQGGIKAGKPGDEPGFPSS